MRPGRAAARRA